MDLGVFICKCDKFMMTTFIYFFYAVCGKYTTEKQIKGLCNNRYHINTVLVL